MKIKRKKSSRGGKFSLIFIGFGCSILTYFFMKKKSKTEPTTMIDRITSSLEDIKQKKIELLSKISEELKVLPPQYHLHLIPTGSWIKKIIEPEMEPALLDRETTIEDVDKVIESLNFETLDIKQKEYRLRREEFLREKLNDLIKLEESCINQIKSKIRSHSLNIIFDPSSYSISQIFIDKNDSEETKKAKKELEILVGNLEILKTYIVLFNIEIARVRFVESEIFDDKAMFVVSAILILIIAKFAVGIDDSSGKIESLGGESIGYKILAFVIFPIILPFLYWKAMNSCTKEEIKAFEEIRRKYQDSLINI